MTFETLKTAARSVAGGMPLRRSDVGMGANSYAAGVVVSMYVSRPVKYATDQRVQEILDSQFVRMDPVFQRLK